MIVILNGCKSDESVRFCEGVKPDGAAFNCGTKFSSGALTVMISTEKQFGTEKIYINVFEIKRQKKIKRDSVAVDVNPNDMSARSNIYFYDEGKYVVEVEANGEKIAEGALEVLDVL